MSAARSRPKEEPKHVSSHPFRNVLMASVLLAALIVWQLNAVMHGLSAVHTWLGHVEGPRRIIIGLVSIGYHRLTSFILLLIHRIH